MKKLMMIALVAVGIMSASAATYNWETSLGDGYDGMTWYVVNGTGVANLTSLLATSGDIAGFQTAIAAYGSNVQTGTFEAGWGGWQDGSFSDAADTVFLFVTDSLTAGSTFYYSAELSTAAYQYTPPSGSPGSLSITTVTSGTIANVPEPTSGLLMLIGFAGLALRRRRA